MKRIFGSLPFWLGVGFLLAVLTLGFPDPGLCGGPTPSSSCDCYAKGETYTKAEVDSELGLINEQLTQGNLRYYFTKTELIAGTRALLATAPALATEAVTFNVTSSTLATYTVQHVSPSVGVASLPCCEITWSRFFSSNQSLSSGRNAEYIPELWTVDSDGFSNPVFVATGSAFTVISTERRLGIGKFTITTLTGMGGTSPTTRRFKIEHYWRRTGVLTSNNPTVTAYCGGEYSGLISAALPSAVVMLTDGSNAASVVALPGALTVTGSTLGSAIVADGDGIPSVVFVYRYGLAVVCPRTGRAAGVFLTDDAGVYEIADPGNSWGVASGADDYNLFFEGGNLKVQKSTAGAATFDIQFIGGLQ